MLKQRAFNATLWSGADILLRQGLQFAITVALARLLTPADFGTIALLVLFTAIASALVDGGLSAALIQRQDVDAVDLSTAFWCSVGIGALAAGVLVLLAPAIADFYKLSILVPLMRLMALNVFLGSLGAVHLALLRKRLQFRRQMLIGVVAAIVSGTLAIAMALRGFGAWSLAVQIVATTSVTTMLLWATGGWWPACSPRRDSLRRLFGFGGYYMAANLLDVAYARLYTLVIGKIFAPRELGYYSNADTTVQLPGGFVGGVFGRVVFPMFSAATGDPAVLRRGKQFAVRGMMLINIPMMLGLAALAGPFVQTVFGERWLPTAPLLSVLCLAALLTPLHMINIHVLLAHGQSRRLFRIEIVKKAIGVMLMLAGARFGLIGIAWSQVLYSVASFLILTRFTGPLVDYGTARQLRESAPAFAIGLAMAALVVTLDRVWDAPPPLKLAALTVVGAAFFAFLAWALRIAALQDMLTLFHRTGHAERVDQEKVSR